MDKVSLNRDAVKQVMADSGVYKIALDVRPYDVRSVAIHTTQGEEQRLLKELDSIPISGVEFLQVVKPGVVEVVFEVSHPWLVVKQAVEDALSKR